MKKWLVTCLLAIALLFVATTAMAAHIRLNGDYCEGNTFEIRKKKKITIRCTVTAAMMSLQRIIGA